MVVVFVHIHLLPGTAEAFLAATEANAAASRREPGVARFDVLREAADALRFALYEVYRDEAAVAAHKETAHYQTWRDTVAPFMAEPRRGVKYSGLSPAPGGWDSALA
jgi:quinol monooxygenase YgiN